MKVTIPDSSSILYRIFYSKGNIAFNNLLSKSYSLNRC